MHGLTQRILIDSGVSLAIMAIYEAMVPTIGGGYGYEDGRRRWDQGVRVPRSGRILLGRALPEPLRQPRELLVQQSLRNRPRV